MFPLDLNQLQVTILMQGRVFASENSDGQHFSCYEKEVRKRPRRQWTAFAEQIELVEILMSVKILYLNF